MIKNTKPLSLSEVKELLKNHEQLEENAHAKTLSQYLKKFLKIKTDKAKELKEALRGLNIEKLKDKHLAKIVDFMPEDADDIKKIFVGEEIDLDQNEVNSILDKVKSFK